MKQVIKGWVFFDASSVEYEWEQKYRFFTGSGEAFSTYIPVVEHSLEVEIPDDFNPRAASIKSLEAKREEATRAFREGVANINAQIAKLQALEWDGSENTPTNYPSEVAA